jgi:hypothetical protein
VRVRHGTPGLWAEFFGSCVILVSPGICVVLGDGLRTDLRSRGDQRPSPWCGRPAPMSVAELIATVVTKPDLPGAACVDHLDVFDACTDRGATFACDEAIQICASQCPAAAIAADRAEMETDARAYPKRSALLDKLLVGEPVIVGWSMLRGRLPEHPPEWLSDPRITTHVRVYPDDLVEPADGPADQRAY